MRKRKVGRQNKITENQLSKEIEYIARHKNIKDVILSGGDPLILDDENLKKILVKIRKIKHVETIRIHSRVVCTLPARITEKLCKILAQFHPIYLNTHINHPDEITEQVIKAADKINRSGIPLGCQTVLLKGVNNDARIMKKLLRKLLKNRIRPYYLHHPDLVKGTNHFRCRVEEGLSIMKSMRGHISGMCIPHYVLDLPGGGGKVPLLPEYIRKVSNNELIIENFQGMTAAVTGCHVMVPGDHDVLQSTIIKTAGNDFMNFIEPGNRKGSFDLEHIPAKDDRGSDFIGIVVYGFHGPSHIFNPGIQAVPGYPGMTFIFVLMRIRISNDFQNDSPYFNGGI